MKKTIILLAPCPPPVGGIGTWAKRMLEANISKWNFDIVDEKVLGNREVFGDKVKRNLFVEIKRCINIWINLKQKLKSNDVFIVHSNIPATIFAMLREYFCAIITKHYKKKFVVHFHCTVPNMIKSKRELFVLKKFIRVCDSIIVLNQKSKDFLLKYTNIPIYVVPNFLDSSELASNKVINKRLKTALYVGGVIEEKGCDDIIELAKDFNDIEFKLVGKSSSKIEELSTNIENVHLLGVKSREEVKKELSNADIFIFLSRFKGEGFSIALLEAMGSGLPCLVTDWAANADMIGSEGGSVVQIGDIKGAKMALNNMLSYDTRKKQSISNINKVKELYCSSVVLNQYSIIYEKLLK